MPDFVWVIIGIIVFVIVMSILVIIHEGGHFLVAKKAGILCHEFSIGMGPVIYQKKKGETVYSIRAFPIGGYVSMAGEEVEDNLLKGIHQVRLLIKNDRVEKIIMNLENPKYQDLPVYDIVSYDLIGTSSADPDELYIEVTKENETQRWIVNRDCMVNYTKKEEIQIAPYDRNFVNKPLLNRFLSVLAGPLMNIILAVVIFFIIGLISGYADTKHTVIGEVTAVENSNNTLETDDEIATINGVELTDWQSLSNTLANISKGGENFTPVVNVTTTSGKNVNIHPSVFVYSIELAFLVDGTNEAIIGEYSNNNEKTASYKGGLRKGDKLLKITAYTPKTDDVLSSIGDGNAVLSKSEVLAFFHTESLETGPDVVIQYSREGKVYETSKIEVYDARTLESQGIEATKVQLGISCKNKFNLGKLLYMPFVQTGESFTMIFKTLGLLFSNSRIGVDDLSGPVGIFSLLKEASKQGIITILTWMGILSVNLGFMNLLPLPALDGGRLAFMVYEAITKKKPNAKVENIIHSIGFMLLMALMLFVTFNDVLRCIGCR